MAGTTINITGPVILPTGVAPSFCTVIFQLSSYDTDAVDESVQLQKPTEVVADTNGDFTLALWPNDRGVRNTYYSVSAKVSVGRITTVYPLGIIALVDGPDVLLADVLTVEVGETPTVDFTSAQSAALAKLWANEDPDVLVDDTEYSAKHYANLASVDKTAIINAAAAALISESNAADSEAGADTSAIDAQIAADSVTADAAQTALDAAATAADVITAAASQAAALASETAAGASESVVVASATAAALSETAAELAETNSETAQAAAETAKANAIIAQTAAETAETSSTASATTAANWAAAAAASFDDFDSRYLGGHDFAPSWDNDGDPLVNGMVFFDTQLFKLRFYNGHDWQDCYTTVISEINSGSVNNAPVGNESPSTGEFTNLVAHTDFVLNGSTPVVSVDTDLSSVSALHDSLTTAKAVKDAIDSRVASSVNFKGGYDASGNSPDLDTSPSGVMIGDMYTCSVAGTFFATAIEVGDVLIAEQDAPTLESHWTVVQKDMDAAGIKVSYEANANTNAFTDADESKLDGIEAGADITDVTNVTAAGALMDSELASEASVKALDQGVATTDSPSFAGLSTTGNMTFDDNDKAIFGAGSDLEIYHDAGGSSYIKETGAGSFYIQADNLYLQKEGGGENYFSGVANSAVSLYYNGVEKLATSSSGVTISGGLTAGASTAGGTGLQLNTGNGDHMLVSVQDTGTAGSANGTIKVSDGGLIFDLDGGEIARFTSSALLVGTTSNGLASSSGATGINLIPDGASAFTRAAGTALYINRLTSDGTLVQLSKDGSSVGSITSSSAGGIGIISQAAMTLTTPDESLHFGAAQFRPYSSDDNTVDLGSSSARWKDGYFGGKIYSNNLDIDGAGVTTLSNIGYFGDNSGSVQYTLRSSDAGTGTIDFGDASDGNIGRIQYNHTSDFMLFRTNNAEAMRLDSSQDASFSRNVTADLQFFWGDGGLSGLKGALSYSAGNSSAVVGTTSAHALEFRTGNSTAMTVDTSGKVGIGTTSPDTPLHAVSSVVTTSWSAYAGTVATFEYSGSSGSILQMVSGNAYTGEIWFGDDDSRNTGRIRYEHDIDALELWASGVVALTLDSSQNATFAGNATTSTVIDIDQPSGTGSLDAYLRFNKNGAGKVCVGYDAGDDTIKLGYGATFSSLSGMAIDSSGNVGIGYTTPTDKLEVAGDISVNNGNGYKVGGGGSTATFIGELHNSSGVLQLTSDSNRDVALGDVANPNMLYLDTSAGELRVNVGGSEAMRIDSSGALLVGVTNKSGSEILRASGDVHFDGDLKLHSASPAISFVDTDGRTWETRGYDNRFSIYDSTAAATRLSIDSSGNVGIGTVSPDVLLHLTDTAGAAIVRLERNDTTLGDTDVYGEIQFEGQDASAGSSAGVRGGIKGLGEGPTGEFALTFETSGGYGSPAEALRLDSSQNATFAGDVTVTDDATINTLTVGLGGGSVSTNTAVGVTALVSNTTGGNNVASGYHSLYFNTTGGSNVASGYLSLHNNTEGNSNVASGYRSLFSNTTGNYNVASGFRSLYSNTTGGENVASGTYSLYDNTTGSNNVGFGYQAGRYITDGSTANETSGTSLYLGADTKALADGGANEIVVGYDTTGNGSNTATWGNDSITDHYFAGDVTIDGTATSGSIDLSAISDTIAVSAVDIFVYDTSLDSDGGAWRKRCQHTSWYNETLNTATRGSRKDFPAVAVIVAESNQVTIYDGDDPDLPMWMVFTRSGQGILAHSIITPTCVSMLNGYLSIGTDLTGIRVIDYISEKTQSYHSNSGATYQGIFLGSVAQRDNAIAFDTPNATVIVNASVNDVAMTVLPNAPIDAATGLQVPTIAVATDGGVSVITDSGAVYDSAYTNAVGGGAFDADGNLYYWRVTYAGYLAYSTVADYEASDGFGDQIGSTNLGYSDVNLLSFTAAKKAAAISGSTFIMGGSDTSGIAVNGLSLYQFDTSDFTKSMSSLLTSTYNTGWMNGDIKGAFLSDTDDTDLVGSGELVTNGGFDSDVTSWTAAHGAISWDAGRLLLTEDGADGSSARAYQTITTVVGSVYEITADIGDISTGNASITASTSTSTGGMPQVSSAENTSVTLTFTAAATTTYIIAAIAGTTARTAYYDNISVKLADEDRSLNNNGLVVNGTITRSPVATGADIVAYSGFSNSNYLEQPYNSDLDFGTGDFSVMGWIKFTSDNAYDLFIDRGYYTGGSYSGNGFNFISGANNNISFRNNTTSILNVGSQPTNVWFCLCVVRRNGVFYSYINGVQESTASNTDNFTNTNATLRVGLNQVGDVPANASAAALWRISATAPTAEQIAKIYEDEKPLFQENAKATLYGTSDAVTALAHDSDTNLLHVGTSAGRSVFQGLRRVENTTTAVGTAISASNGLVVEE